jgi:hypothetical protein
MTTAAPRRFSDRGRYQYEFQHEYAVRCPGCGKKAFVFPADLAWRAKSAKLSCADCGHNAQARRTNPRGQFVGITRRRLKEPSDPFFHLPLWFVGEVKREQFWAYNSAHLEFLKNYLGATLRIREPHINGSMASRLPAFLTDRKNRAAALKAIAELEQR